MGQVGFRVLVSLAALVRFHVRATSGTARSANPENGLCSFRGIPGPPEPLLNNPGSNWTLRIKTVADGIADLRRPTGFTD